MIDFYISIIQIRNNYKFINKSDLVDSKVNTSPEILLNIHQAIRKIEPQTMDIMSVFCTIRLRECQGCGENNLTEIYFHK